MRLSASVDQFPETDITTATLHYGSHTLALSFAVAGKCYDLFKDASGDLVAGPAWATNTVRDLSVAEDGETIVNAADYGGYAVGELELVGGFRCHANGQTRDAMQSRLVWSLKDAVIKPVCRIETIASWSYNAPAWRQARGSSLNQIEVFNGVSGRHVDVTASVYMVGTGGLAAGFVGIGIDTSSADSAQVKNPAAAPNTFPVLPGWARYAGYVGIGYHELRWLERGVGGGAQTWFGNGGQPYGYQNGIIGSVVV